jgi:hypothetical protein
MTAQATVYPLTYRPGETWRRTEELRWNVNLPPKPRWWQTYAYQNSRLEQKWVCTETGRVEWHRIPVTTVGFNPYDAAGY